MRKINLLTILATLIILSLAIPASAMSLKAENFLRACRTLDAPFPPKNWSDRDIRAASLEILDEIEAGRFAPWASEFCVTALGVLGNPDDLPRILAYEDGMTCTVLRALKGFSHPDAIECLFRQIDSDTDTTRELAVKSLAAMNFNKMKEPMLWYVKVLDALKTAYKKETVDWLKDDIQKAISDLRKPLTSGSNQKSQN